MLRARSRKRTISTHRALGHTRSSDRQQAPVSRPGAVAANYGTLAQLGYARRQARHAADHRRALMRPRRPTDLVCVCTLRVSFQTGGVMTFQTGGVMMLQQGLATSARRRPLRTAASAGRARAVKIPPEGRSARRPRRLPHPRADKAVRSQSSRQSRPPRSAAWPPSTRQARPTAEVGTCWRDRGHGRSSARGAM
jgi:hypothetical protein